MLHLGHHGAMCPDLGDPWLDVDGDTSIKDVDLLQDGTDQEPKVIVEEGSVNVVNIVHTTGVFKHKVQWCQCPGAKKKTVQLFQMQLFPASHLQPKTAFTFDVLDNFHIDAMECKTAASSFMRKSCCLTNNAFPHIVLVGSTFFQPIKLLSTGAQNRERELRCVSRQWRDL